MIKSIRMIAISVLVAGLALLVTPIARAQDSVFVTATGKVGIGTATPVSQLDIVADIANESARVRNINAAGYPGFSYFDETGAIGLFFGLDNANNNTRLNSVNNNPIVILTNSTERIRFPAPGGNFITAANGASLTAGGTWADASSRDFKKDIVNLDATEAVTAIKQLDPVKFQYKSEPGEQYLGFIAEDVPELVARNDHKSLSPMEIVAVLTKVVQEQQKTIEELTAKVAELADLEELVSKLEAPQ